MCPYYEREVSKYLYFMSCKIWKLEKSKFLVSAFGKK